MTRSRQVAAVLMLAGVSLSAQQPASPPPAAVTSQPPTFKLGVNDIDVDVVVTDAQGHAVRGLTKDDFRVFEDGKPQDISAFSAVEIPVGPKQPSDVKATPPSDVVSNAQPFDGRLYVMVIDDLHTQPGEAPRLKAVAQQFVREDFGSTDLMMVMHTAGAADASQTFTNDKKLLSAAIEGTSGLDVGRQLSQGDGYSFDQMQAADARSTLATLQAVVGRLANVKTRRKAILFLSGGIDYDIRNLVPDDGGHALMNVEPGAQTSSNQWGTAVMDAMRAAVDAAMRANVAIYSIDPRGLASPGGLAQDSLRALAEETGGSAVVGRNDFGPAFQRIVADNSAYYVLAYAGTERRDGKFHTIDVRVDRPGVTVKARRGYTALKPNAKSTTEKVDESAWIREALDSPFPLSSVTLDLFATAFKDSAKNASVLVGTELRGSDLELTDGDTIQIAYDAVDAKGKTFGARIETVTLHPKPETQARIEQTGIRVLNRMNLPPGNYKLRVAARDGSGRLGSVFENLVVPDFSKPLMLSGVVLTSTTASATPTPKADDALRQLLPGPPGGLRAFPQMDTAAFYTEAYDNEAGAPHIVDLRATVTDDSGRTFFKTVETRSSAELRSGSGRVGFTARVPLSDLPVGSYTLTVTAESRGGGIPAATRQVGFFVTPGRTAVPTDATPVAPVPCCPNAAAYEVDVRAFAHGDRTAAAVAIVRAPLSQLQHGLSSIDARDMRLLQDAAAMHLVLAARAMEAERYEEMLVQLAVSDAIFQRIRFSAEDPQFASNWYIASAVMQINAVDIDAAEALVGRGIKANVAPAEMRLSAGIVHETAAGLESRRIASACASCPNATLLRGYGPGIARPMTAPEWSDQRQRTAELNEAEDAYRQSLEADATMEEARLRLGRTLLLEGKGRDARVELARVVNESRDARLSYLAHLFLADLSDRAADNDGAVREYSAALAISPSSREAYIGLSNLALRAGDDRQARDYIEQWMRRPTSTVVDPWNEYQRGLDQLEPALQALLRIISQ